MNDKKTYYNLGYNEEQLEIIITALEEAKNYYNDYLYDVYDNFDELSEIIRELRGLRQ
ncbi:MAG: hypothetical protein PUI98_07110 [Finegoldia magna]|nr:hypothetical protein [Finegoldia magna]